MNKLGVLALHILVALALSSHGQKQSSSERHGDKAFMVHNFARAVQFYVTAFKRTDENGKRMEIAYKIGKAYHRMNQFSKALQWYEDALGEERNNTGVLVEAADAALRNSEPEKAKAYLQKALTLNPLHENARQLMDAVALWKDHSSIPLYGLNFSKAPEGINSSFSDYAPRWLGNELVITSSRPAEGLVSSFDGRTMQDYSRLYLFISKVDGSYGEAIALPVDRNRNAGVFAWDAAHKRVFFTSCNNRRKQCLILESTFDQARYSFSRPKVPSFVNPKYHYGHPYVSADGKWIYFSARLPGGYGGNDIYSVSIKPDGSFGLPANAGPYVNTKGEEQFPATAGDSVLFFSSDGHKGYGGLDLFASTISGAGHGRPHLLPPPINSTADDLGLSLKPGMNHAGALSSDRGGQGDDNIYFFDGCSFPVLVHGIVSDAADSKPLAGAQIILTPNGPQQDIKTDIQGRFRFYYCSKESPGIEASLARYRSARVNVHIRPFGENKTIEMRLSKREAPAGLSGVVVHRETKKPIANQPVRLTRPGMPERVAYTTNNGFYAFDTVPVNRIYTIKIERQGFFNESRVINIPETNQPVTLNRQNGYDLDFELTPIVLKREIVINNIYYDFDKANLRESSKMELGKLVSLLRDNPGIRIQISSHTDERGRATYNEKLSAMRAQSVVDYLVQSGLSAGRLTAQGHGSRFPVVKNARTEQEHQTNRRTTFQVTDLNAPSQAVGTPVASAATKNKRLVYRVQFLITSTKRNPEIDFIAIVNLAEGLRVFEETTGLLFRYEAGDRYTLAEAEALRNQIRASGFPDSFVVPYIDHQRVTMQQAREFKP